MNNNSVIVKESGNLMGDSVIVNGDRFDIRSVIYTISGVQVMLDRDLAAAYQVTTSVFNQAVKRNANRFPEGFRFQLSKEENDVLISQIVTSKRNAGHETRGGYHKLPYAFTEQGIAMLSGVLKSDVAVAVSIRIMNAFVNMRRSLSLMAPMLTRLESVERRQITDQSRNEARFDEIFRKMSEDDVPDCQIFYQNKFWDAKSLLVRIIRRAKKELVVVDAYPDVATLDILAKRGRGVKVELITHSNGELEESDFEAFGKQCGKFTKSICGICHDRFIIIDNVEIYAIGASLKDAGRLTFGISKMGDSVIPGLLANLRNATSARTEYAK